MDTEFKIKELTSWADIELICGQQKIEFSASYVYPDSFSELATALVDLKTKKKTSAVVTFDLERDGLLYFIFTTYPQELIRLSVYQHIVWDDYENLFEDQPMPVPIFESILPDIHYFSRMTATEFEKYGKEGFSAWENDFFDDRIIQMKTGY